jgi:hypothetical protein
MGSISIEFPSVGRGRTDQTDLVPVSKRGQGVWVMAGWCVWVGVRVRSPALSGLSACVGPLVWVCPVLMTVCICPRHMSGFRQMPPSRLNVGVKSTGLHTVI